MAQENHRQSMRVLLHETWHCNSSRVFPLSECIAGASMNNILVCESEKRETKPITNKELHRRDPLVGNGITQPFNWMGLTFAEQGVTAFA